jgi:hypothetical protein
MQFDKFTLKAQSQHITELGKKDEKEIEALVREAKKGF